MTMQVQPDRAFIAAMKEAGGDALKQCYQCATCSVACPLSQDGEPFPRREMIYAQWGLKDKLMGDPNVYLCHQCGDCTALCPRGARPGDVLGAVRAYAYTAFGWPQGLAKLCTSAKNLWILCLIPTAVIFFLWLISGGMKLPGDAEFARHGYQHFFGSGFICLLSKNVIFIDIIMLTCLAIAAFSFYKGVTAMWRGMKASIKGSAVAYRPGCCQFLTEFLWPSIVEIVKHSRFEECKANYDRVRGHKPLMWAFIGLFIVTVYSFFTADILGIIWPELHGPIHMWNPMKWLANVAGIAMIYGTVALWMNRRKMEEDGSAKDTFYDWFYLWIIAGVGVTGMGAEIARLLGAQALGYIIYFLHLVSVAMLFLYLPYSKFAHVVYRTVAYCFDRYRNSAYVNNPLNE